ncbi:hypothetical protein [Streptomyces sp. A0642]|uniref:hypothetical protein n=1 Tax=Streptomyces sp. A0642 TaxID=2563100 RepID=UPI001F0F79A2|nr:hypothetical protein [Streptomyces sp. A0642]
MDDTALASRFLRDGFVKLEGLSHRAWPRTARGTAPANANVTAFTVAGRTRL